MPLMTVEANPELLMFAMAGRAILFAVGARHLVELLLDLNMAGDTNRRLRLVTLQIQLERLMRRMAGTAVANRIVPMLARRMAEEAGVGDPYPLLGVFTVAFKTGIIGMILMTSNAGYLVTMSSP